MTIGHDAQGATRLARRRGEAPPAQPPFPQRKRASRSNDSACPDGRRSMRVAPPWFPTIIRQSRRVRLLSGYHAQAPHATRAPPFPTAFPADGNARHRRRIPPPEFSRTQFPASKTQLSFARSARKGPSQTMRRSFEGGYSIRPGSFTPLRSSCPRNTRDMRHRRCTGPE